jgi:hypothetical protein
LRAGRVKVIIMGPPFRHLAAQACRCAILWCGLLTVAQAHDTISFDPNAPSQFSMNGTWGQTTPTALHGFAIATLRPDTLEIDLTMADGAAYKLLDPSQATTGTANATTDVTADQFAKDEPLFIERARTFFKVTNNGVADNLGSVTVELTTARDIVFHLLFPPVAPGPLHLEMTYLGQIPTGEKDLLTVLDHDGVTLASATLGADNPSLDVTVPVPGALAPGSKPRTNPWPIMVIGGLTVAVVLALLNKLRKPHPEG